MNVNECPGLMEQSREVHRRCACAYYGNFTPLEMFKTAMAGTMRDVSVRQLCKDWRDMFIVAQARRHHDLACS